VDSVFWVGEDADEASRECISGPFDSEQQMLDAIVKIYARRKPGFRNSHFYGRVLPLVLRGHTPVFTHGDFQRKNIVVRNDGAVVLVDWEAAGWYPGYWEYATAMSGGGWDDDWKEWGCQDTG
jgi:thiamine kinase-like enzyme